MTKNEGVVELASGNIRLWVEQRNSICIKAANVNGDAVELTVHDINELIRTLRILKARLD